VLLATAAGCAKRAATPESRASAARPLRLGVDVHQHLTLAQAVPLYSGEPGQAEFFATEPGHVLVNQIQPEALEAAGVRLVFAALWPPPALRPARDAMGEALDQLEKLRAFTARRPEFSLAMDVTTARAALARGRIVAIPTLEGAEAIRTVEDVDRLFAAGIRVIGLTHFVDNGLAAADEQFALVGGGEDAGLTDLGRAAVRRMFELGILVDLAHASDRAMSDTLDLAEEHRVPVLFSHAGGAARYLRTLPDTLAQRIARGGGLIGVGLYWSGLLKDLPEEDRFPGFVPDTCDEVVAHWVHYAKLVGPDHVVLGSDLSSMILRPPPGGGCPQGLRNAFDLPAFFAALETAGVPRESLDDSGERVLRLLDRLERQASPEARARALEVPAHPSRSLLDVPL
jgi:membrane dipeptidase